MPVTSARTAPGFLVAGTGRPDSDSEADALLLDAVSRGDRRAFGELYRLHYDCAHGLARTLLGSAQDADDLVAESFAKVFQRMLSGSGTIRGFRSYLLTTVRMTSYERMAGEGMIDRRVEFSELVLPAVERDPVVEEFDATLAARALDSLPERWRTVLIHVEIERRPIITVAGLLGIQPNAVSALAFRARRALRVAYVQLHVMRAGDAACREPSSHLAAWSCGRLGHGLRLRVRQHLAGCASCSNAVREVVDLLAQLPRSACCAVDRRCR
jgi:RNA polymerase sigma factor (sigma-70 family)